MQSSKMSSKDQKKIPKIVRNRLQLSEGDQIAFSFEDRKISISKLDIEKMDFAHADKVVT